MKTDLNNLKPIEINNYNNNEKSIIFFGKGIKNNQILFYILITIFLPIFLFLILLLNSKKLKNKNEIFIPISNYNLNNTSFLIEFSNISLYEPQISIEFKPFINIEHHLFLLLNSKIFFYFNNDLIDYFEKEDIIRDDSLFEIIKYDTDQFNNIKYNFTLIGQHNDLNGITFYLKSGYPNLIFFQFYSFFFIFLISLIFFIIFIIEINFKI